jgi:predicted dithiol-disulfide oxidoreductase (DUF899 family)
MNDALPEVVSEQEWQKAFDAMLVKEKELTRARDEVAAARRRMPFTPTWAILDVTPFGRQEEWEDSPAGRPQSPPYEWWRLHDEYGSA